MSSNGVTGADDKSTNCAEGYETMDEDETSDSEMNTGQGTPDYYGLGDVTEHRG